MSTQESIFSAVEQAIKDVLNNQSLSVKPEHTLLGDLGLESIDLLDVSSELENSVGKELDFKEVAQFVKEKSGGAADMKNLKVQDLVQYLVAHE